MEEIIDILDENGIKTGQTATRYEIHRQGFWHKVTAIIVLDTENRILLQQRSTGKMTNPGKWDIAAAGHVDAGEDSFTTIIRETHEEIGLKINESASAQDFHFVLCYRTEKCFTLHGEDLIDRQFQDCYILRNQNIDPTKLKLQASEVQAAKLYTLAEFKQMIANGELINRQPFYDAVIDLLEKES